MTKNLKTAQPAPSFLDKPAKERILEASDKLFRLFGVVRVSLGAIAEEAHSNVETVIKHYGNYESLVSLFVKSQIRQAAEFWQEVEAKHPNDPEGRLRYWTFYEEGRKDSLLGPEELLSRTAAELWMMRKTAFLVEIEDYWQSERRRVVKLCETAQFREPRDLADKLLLLVQGARNERGAYGYHAPSHMLHRAADDLLVAHGGARKPPISWDDV